MGKRAKPSGDPFWTTHISRAARIQFFAGVLFLWSAQAFLYEMAASRPAGPWQIAVWALYTGATGAAWAWCFTFDLRGLFLVVPLSFFLPSQFGEGFWNRSPDPHRLAVGIAALAAIIAAYIFFLRFIITEGASSLRMRTEINLARDIHAALVPPIELRTSRVELRGVSYPTTEVGGDLLDALPDAGGDAVFLADVSGHGVPAGVLMAMIKSAIRVRARAGAPLDALVRDINAVIHESTEPRMFATFAAMRFGDGSVEYAVAGHPPILWYRAAHDRVERLENEHPPLGILAEHAFGSRRIACDPGDVFLFFTDGLTEVRGRDGEEFGEQRLEALLERHAREPLADLQRALLAAVRDFGAQEDDQTLLVARAAAPPAARG